MSVFGSIMSKIFHHPAAKAAQPSPRPAAPAAAATGGTAAPAAATQRQAEAPVAVDVEAVLQAMAQDSGQDLNWRQSIVDLLKLLSIDSSRANREDLARELGYSGSTEDSAAMNVWLHKAVMAKLAENGGVVPDSLR